jgi:hypothetical protein
MKAHRQNQRRVAAAFNVVDQMQETWPALVAPDGHRIINANIPCSMHGIARDQAQIADPASALGRLDFLAPVGAKDGR